MTNIESKPLILITNDDGDTAKGIQVLTDIMLRLGNVIVMAPDGPRSAQSNAITVTHPIRYKKSEETENIIRYSCTGTPTDCIKLALNEVVPRKPDLIVSGINHGSNAAVNVIYSGTMGAVLEGCENGINSIGFSICDHSFNANFTFMESYIYEITKKVLENPLPRGICLNVNAPVGKISDVKICRQCDGQWTKEFARRVDPAGRNYFWLTGSFENFEPDATDTDEWALANGFISVVPTKIDLTAYDFLGQLQKILK